VVPGSRRRRRLYGPRRKILADKADDARRSAGEGRGEFDPVAVVITAAGGLGFVLPSDAEQIDGIDIIDATLPSRETDGLPGFFSGSFSCAKVGTDDVALAAAADGFFKNFLVGVIGHRV